MTTSNVAATTAQGDPERIFLITGASSGIGAATARHAVAAGHRVVLAARSLERLEALAAELGGAERALAVRCDVTEWADQQALARAALEAFGRVDVAFANAGFGVQRGFLNDSPERWREMVLTNVYGAALTVRATLPALSDSRGHLLLTGSVAGRRALPGSLYSCEPGAVDTPFFEERPTNALHDDDIARAVMFAVAQPPHVDVNEILVRPTGQPA